MPRGGHSRSGPLQADAFTRSLHAAPTRSRHRRTASLAGVAGAVRPPAGLTPAELRYWKHYAPVLRASRRFTPASRDCLAKYCTVLAVVAELRATLVDPDPAARRDARKELRQWLLVGRLYESDLTLNPASALRAPSAPASTVVDPFAKYETPFKIHGR